MLTDFLLDSLVESDSPPSSSFKSALDADVYSFELSSFESSRSSFDVEEDVLLDVEATLLDVVLEPVDIVELVEPVELVYLVVLGISSASSVSKDIPLGA